MTGHTIGENAVVDNSMITDGCNIKGTVKHSILFAGVTVENGAIVEDAVVMGNSVINKLFPSGSGIRRKIITIANSSANAVVKHCIIAENAVIGEGAVVGATPEDGGVGEVATVAPGVTIGAGAKIGPNAMVYNDVEEGGEQC